MFRRRDHTIAYLGAARGRLLPALVVVGVVAVGPSSTAQVNQPQIVRWEIQATVFDIVDPDGIFSTVRLGDPVRGMLKYDVNGYFDYPRWFGLVSMTIENPRTGQDLKFFKDLAGVGGLIVYFDAHPDPTTESDYLEILQTVVAPEGFQGETPVVEALFEGPPDVLQGGNPLANLNLDAWPIAILKFYDWYDAFDMRTYIEAEISSMTPITTPLAAADFDYDGRVDAVDLYAWMHPSVSPTVIYADADGDGRSDGADFLAWQQQVDFAAPADFPNAPIPEPATLMLLIVATAGIRRLRSQMPQRTRHRVTLVIKGPF